MVGEAPFAQLRRGRLVPGSRVGAHARRLTPHPPGAHPRGVKKASEYRQHAAECRQLANKMGGEHRDQLLEMAATWDALAHDRAELIRRHPELAMEGERPDAD